MPTGSSSTRRAPRSRSPRPQRAGLDGRQHEGRLVDHLRRTRGKRVTDLTAIDILVNPDADTLGRAREINARMRQSVPDGFRPRCHPSAAHHDAPAIRSHRGPGKGPRRSRGHPRRDRHCDVDVRSGRDPARRLGGAGPGPRGDPARAGCGRAQFPGSAARRRDAIHRIRWSGRSLRAGPGRGDQPEHQGLGRRVRPQPGRRGQATSPT